MAAEKDFRIIGKITDIEIIAVGQVRTIYQVLPDASAAKSNYLRIVDETGEDYLYKVSGQNSSSD